MKKNILTALTAVLTLSTIFATLAFLPGCGGGNGGDVGSVGTLPPALTAGRAIVTGTIFAPAGLEGAEGPANKVRKAANRSLRIP